MSDTLPNITIPANEWVDLYLLSGIAVGTPIAVEMVGVCDVYLAIKETQPAPDYDAYNVLKRHGDKLRNTNGDSGAWAFCQGAGGKVAVREFDTVTEGFYPGITMPVSEDFLLEVAKGNVPGHSVATFISRNPNAGPIESDLWGGGGSNMVYPVAAETWEIVSTSVNDTAGGSGAQLVLVNYLDDDCIEQPVVASMNGTTPVVLNADHYRPNGAVVIGSGASQENEGDIIVRVSGGGNPRQYILASYSVSQDAHITVPAGKTFIGIRVVIAFPKDNDGHVVTKFQFQGTNTWITTGRFPFYQNITTLDIEGQFNGPEKTDLKLVGESTNTAAEVTVANVFLIVDNSVL